MVARSEDFRNGHAFEYRRTGIPRVIQQTRGEAVGLGGLQPSQHPGNPAEDRLEEQHHRDFSTGRDEVTHADDVRHSSSYEPLVDTTVAAAEHYQIPGSGEIPRQVRVEPPPIGSEHYRPAPLMPGDRAKSSEQRLRADDHTGAAAELVVVHRASRIDGEAPDVHELDADQPGGNGPADYSAAQEGPEEVGEQSCDRNPQNPPSSSVSPSG